MRTTETEGRRLKAEGGDSDAIAAPAEPDKHPPDPKRTPHRRGRLDRHREPNASAFSLQPSACSQREPQTYTSPIGQAAVARQLEIRAAAEARRDGPTRAAIEKLRRAMRARHDGLACDRLVVGADFGADADWSSKMLAELEAYDPEGEPMLVREGAQPRAIYLGMVGEEEAKRRLEQREREAWRAQYDPESIDETIARFVPIIRDVMGLPGALKHARALKAAGLTPDVPAVPADRRLVPTLDEQRQRLQHDRLQSMPLDAEGMVERAAAKARREAQEWKARALQKIAEEEAKRVAAHKIRDGRLAEARAARPDIDWRSCGDARLLGIKGHHRVTVRWDGIGIYAGLVGPGDDVCWPVVFSDTSRTVNEALAVLDDKAKWTQRGLQGWGEEVGR